MSTVRLKRKHVLDSDSDEDEADAPAASVAEVREREASDVKARLAAIAAKAAEDASASAPAPRKRLASAADREAERAAAAAHTSTTDPALEVVTLDDDSDGDSDAGDEDEDEALRRCAKISRRLRRALGQDVGSRDGPLSPGSAAKPGTLTSKRHLVTVDDVAAVAGEGSLAPNLKPYQLIGINFLLLLDEQDVPGAILADEMGLGKTAQTIAYLTYSRHRKARGVGGWSAAAAGRREVSAEPALVVAPASLLENWRRELERWAPSLRVGFFHGAAAQAETRDRADAWARSRGDGRTSSGGGAFDVIIACYSLFERDSAEQKTHRQWLRTLNYSHLVLDEAHLVKNRATQRAKRLDAVAAKARRRVLLTGTPLQNNLLELESLIHLVLPGLLQEGALADDGEEGLPEATREAHAAARAARVKTILAPFILRRLKEEVATELIAKRHEKLIVGMASKQADAYARAVDAAREERARQNTGTDAEPSDAKVKALFTHLRKIANHPLLVRSRYDEDAVDQIVSACHRRGVFGNEASVDRVREHVSGLSDFDLHQLCVDAQTMGSLRHLALPSSAVADSGKTARLLELCDELRAKGSRPLIFSQWKIVLDILEWAMRERGHAFVRLDGSTNVEERQRICDAFNAEGSDLFAFLLSTRAGGQGLNLVGADAVVIHDCDFNPQIDRQAEDRAHRLGQTRPVTVYRLVTADTVDERIVSIAEKKLDLDAAILSDGKAMAAEENRAMHSIIQNLLR